MQHGPGFESVQGHRFFYLQNFNTGCGAQSAPYAVDTGALSSGVWRPERETDHSRPSNSVIKNDWNYTSTPFVCSDRFTILFVHMKFCSAVSITNGACFSPSTAHSGFHQVARMMDSLILDSFSPFTFTKITTTHRPVRAGDSKRSTGTQHPRQKAAPVRVQHPADQGEGPSMTSHHWSEPHWRGRLIRIVFVAGYIGVS